MKEDSKGRGETRVIGENDVIEVDFVRGRLGIDTALTIHEKNIPDTRAKIAFALLQSWGMVAAVQDGEDSQGRAKLRLQTPDELIVRAFTVAELAYSEMVKRGWSVATGSYAALEPHKGSW